MNPTTLLLLSFCCVALFRVLFARQHYAYRLNNGATVLNRGTAARLLTSHL